MNVWIKRVLIGVGGLLGVMATGGGVYAWTQASAFDAAMDKVYDVPVPEVTLSTDPAVLARGKHLSESVVPCAASDCHGKDLSGGKTIAMGPLGTFTGPNVTKAGLGAVYSPGELFRLIRHGIKKDGRSVRFMPCVDWYWLSDADVTAIVSYVATLPPVKKENGPLEIGLLGKILDRQDKIPFDIAGRIDHDEVGRGPAPTPTKEYGAYLAKLCQGCHGHDLSGGPMPGAPPDFPVPANLTPDETGLRGWTFEDFERLLNQGVRKDGTKVDPMMPTEAFGKLDDTEKHALYAYLMSLPPKPFGNR